MAKKMQRTERALRRKAGILGIGLGHRLNRRQADVLDPIKGLREQPSVANRYAPGCRRRLAKPPDFRYIPLGCRELRCVRVDPASATK
jgi:hypothetical protein